MDLFDGAYLRREFARLNERIDRLESKLDRIADALGTLALTVPTPDVEPVVRDLLRAGHKLQAIKAYQRSAGVDLATAEAFIDRWGDRIARAPGESES